VMPAEALPISTRVDVTLVQALHRAFRWKTMLDERRYASVGDIARTEKIDRTYVGDILRLTLPAPGYRRGDPGCAAANRDDAARPDEAISGKMEEAAIAPIRVWPTATRHTEHAISSLPVFRAALATTSSTFVPKAPTKSLCSEIA
jgi:hypothetical protein